MNGLRTFGKCKMRSVNCKVQNRNGGSQSTRNFAIGISHFSICSNRAANSRRGLTLFEVVLSLAIFLGALTALSQLAHNGSRAAVQARFQSQAILRCESKLAEVTAGVVPLEAVEGASFEDDPEHWTWSLAVEQGPHDDLLALAVTVRYSGASLANVSQTLRRFVRDPQLYIDAALNAPEE